MKLTPIFALFAFSLVASASFAERGDATLAVVKPVATASSSAVTASSVKTLTGNAKIYHDLMERHGDAFVRVKYVMSMNFMGGDSRQEVETSAVIVDADGLILVADSMINPKSMMNMSAMPPGMDFPDMKSDEFRVRMGDSDADLDAELITHDSDLGLAWLKLKAPPKNLHYIDLTQSSTLEIGQAYYGISRTSEDYGNVIIGSHGTIVGKTDTPVKSFLVSGPTDLAFAADGTVVGFVTLKIGKDFMMGARGGNNPQSMIYADKLANATALARKSITLKQNEK